MTQITVPLAKKETAEPAETADVSNLQVTAPWATQQEDPKAPEPEPFSVGVDALEVAAPWPEAEEEGETVIRSNVRLAQDSTPEQVAEDAKMAKLAGVDTEFVARNRQEVKNQHEQQSIVDMTRGQHGVMNYLGIRENAAVSRNDVDNLTGFEKIVRAAKELQGDISQFGENVAQEYRGGEDQVRLAQLRFDQLMGATLDPDATAEVKRINQRLSVLPQHDSFLEQMIYGPIRMAPQWVESLKQGTYLGGQYGLGAGLAAATLGQAGPQIATPEEIITVPAATLGGFQIGFTQASAETAFKLEAGLAFDEFMQLKDTQGNPIDVDVARAASLSVGAVNAGLELFQLKTVVESMPGGKRLLTFFTREGMKKTLKNETVAAAFKTFVKTYGKTWAVETATETAQDVVNMVGREVAQLVDEGEYEGMTPEEFRQQIWDSTVSNLATMAIPSGIGPSVGMMKDTVSARRANRDAQVFEEMDASAAESATRASSPDHYERAIASIKKEAGTEVENVYIPADSLMQQLPQETVEQLLDDTGTREQYAEAIESGGDIRIPLEKYARHIAGTEIANALADHRKFTPEGMTTEEARIFTQEAAADAAELVRANEEAAAEQERLRAEVKTVTDPIAEQLREAGRTTEEINASVQVWDSFVSTMANRGYVESPSQLAAAFRPDIIRKDVDTVVSDPTAYYQKVETAAKAAVTLETPSGKPIIYLLRNADISSFMHESGHVWLNAFKHMATQEGATEAAATEWGSIREALGIGEDNNISVAQHEKFAQELEGYLKEGKAPSSKLIRAFQSFAAWVRAIYRGYDDVIVSPELKPVFDRLLATDEEITEAESYYEAQKPFIELASIENQKQRDRYLKNIAKAQENSRERMFRRYTRAYIQALGGKKRFRELAREQLAEIPAYQVQDVAMADKRGFDAVALDAYVGEDKRKQLSKKRVGLVRLENGLPPEIIAANHGYDSVNAMVDDVLAAKPRAEFIKGVTDYLVTTEEQRVREGLREEGTLLADEDYHSDERLAVLASEVFMLEQNLRMKGMRQKGRVRQIEVRAIRDAARIAIGDKYVKDAVSYSKYAAAERKAAVQADRARREGNEDLAEQWKRKELLNHALVLEAMKAREERVTIEKRIKRHVNAKAGNVQESYHDQIKLLSGTFGLTGKAPAEGTPSLRTFIGDLMGEIDPESPVMVAPPPAPGWMSDNTKRPSGGAVYSDTLTMADFRELDKMVSWLYKQGRALELGRLASYEKSLKEVVAENIKPMAEADDKKIYREGTFIRGLSDRTRRLMAEHEMLPFMLDMFDGFTNLGRNAYFGPNKKNTGLKLAECETNRQAITQQMIEKLDAPFLQFKKSVADNRSVTTSVPVPDIMAKDGRVWTQDKIIAVALNMGNDTNMQRLEGGYSLTRDDVVELTKNLSRDDWAAVQEVWSIIDSYWTPLNDVHEQIAHYRREKVKANAVSVIASDGSVVDLDGGYYPLKYDGILSRRVAEWTETDDLMQNQVFGHPKVQDGMMQDRVQKSALPPLLDLSVVTSHLESVANYISHAAAIKDLDRITNNPEFRDMVDAKYGRDVHMMIRPLLKNIANPERAMGVSLDKSFDKMRALSSAYILGFNPSVALKQPFSVGGLVNDIGAKSFIQGIAAVTAHPVACFEAMHEMSPYMRNRSKNLDRDIKQSTQAFKAKKWQMPRKVLDSVRATSFGLIRLMDFLTVYPSWWGAYKKGMATHNNPKKAAQYADEMIRQSQPSATPMDLSKMQYNRKGLTRFMSMFMTFTAKYGNRQRMYWRGWRAGKVSSYDYMRQLMLESIAPPLLMNMMFAGIWGEDQDPEAAFVDTVAYQFAGIVFVRDIAGVVASVYKKYGMEKDSFKPDLTDIPALKGWSLASRTIESLGAMLADLDDDDNFDKAVWSFAELASFWSGVAAAPLYKRLSEGMRQFDEEGAGAQNILLPNPALRK